MPRALTLVEFAAQGSQVAFEPADLPAQSAHVGMRRERQLVEHRRAQGVKTTPERSLQPTRDDETATELRRGGPRLERLADQSLGAVKGPA